MLTLVGGLILVALFFATTTMMMQSIRERTPGFAVLMTLGFSDRSLFLFVLAEAAVLCVAAAAFGLMKGANMLLLMPSRHASTGILVGVKELEYLASGTPVLSLGRVLDEIREAAGTQLTEASDPNRAAEVGARLSSGYTWVNNHGAAFLDERAPFGGLRSSVDVNIQVWEPEEERWRLLTLAERELLWERAASSKTP